MPSRFGTDGLRGVANTELTPEIALALGRAAARVLDAESYLAGRDTRRSGPMLQAALSVGLASEGRDVLDVGVIPTPGLGWLAARRRLPAAMISASHNPFADNGIKLLGRGGTKLPLETEEAIESALEAILGEGPGAGPRAAAGLPGNRGEGVGVLSRDETGVEEYTDWLVALPGGAMPDGEVVVDCANGAASTIAPKVLDRLGVEHHLLSASPQGTNINAGCGSTHLDTLVKTVLERGASLGIAFDGDADRMLAVDHTGRVVDGDYLIVLFANDLQRSGRLAGGAVVVTLLSNMGLRIALEAAGIGIVETAVGDRNVADAMESGGYVLGGEQSGHLIFGQHAATGDGMLTALKLLDLLGREGRPLADLASEAMDRLPQVMVNVFVPEPRALGEAAAVWQEAEAVGAELGERGRVLLRPSGTEPFVRVMVEAPTEADATRYASRIADVVARELT